MTPKIGTMIYWRWKAKGGVWIFGYVAETVAGSLVRLGHYNGDHHGGVVVDPTEIEWKKHS